MQKPILLILMSEDQFCVIQRIIELPTIIPGRLFIFALGKKI